LPSFLHEQNWPDSVKKDFTGQLHKFMSTLTEAKHQSRNETVLYIPSEEISDMDLAAKDKDLIQRLETTLIHWTRQIKEVVSADSSADSLNDAENAGPLEEIKFWASRTQDLKRIANQLTIPDLIEWYKC